MAPLAVGGDGPEIVAADGDAVADGALDLGEVGAQVVGARDAVGDRHAAVFHDEDFLIGEPPVKAAQRMIESLRPDGGLQETAVRSVLQQTEFPQLPRRQAPVVIEADEVLRADRLLRTEL